MNIAWLFWFISFPLPVYQSHLPNIHGNASPQKCLFELVLWVCFPKQKFAVNVRTLMKPGNFMVSSQFFLDNSEIKQKHRGRNGVVPQLTRRWARAIGCEVWFRCSHYIGWSILLKISQNGIKETPQHFHQIGLPKYFLKSIFVNFHFSTDLVK